VDTYVYCWMYFTFTFYVYWFAKIFVEKMNSQTNEKSQWCHIFKNEGKYKSDVYKTKAHVRLVILR
jgi:hypothetical protein